MTRRTFYWVGMLSVVLCWSAVARGQEAADTAFVTPAVKAAVKPDDGKVRVIVFGAHPDDAEAETLGTSTLWTQQGHHVKLVSVTNGDIGHFRMCGPELAVRRAREVEQIARLCGHTAQVLDIHDGELMPTLENRRTFTRLIRQWQADLVIGHRPNDYHPDHRYVGVLMQDSAYMVTVPFFCSDTPYLTRNPVFLYSSDHFQRPNPFRPDIVVAIDDVIEKKLDGLVMLESQFVEGGANGSREREPKTPEAREKRKAQVRENFRRGCARAADQHRDKLIELYGEEKGKKVRYAESFEICEYGRRPSKEEIRRLFPFFPQP